MLVGMLAAFLSSAVDGLSMVFERYGLHHGASDRSEADLLDDADDGPDGPSESRGGAADTVVYSLLAFAGWASRPLFCSMSAFAAIMRIAFFFHRWSIGCARSGARRMLSINP